MPGIRELLNRNSGIVATVISLVTLAAVVLATRQMMAGKARYPTALPEAYFTVDEGKTFFIANTENVPPFEYQGKQAVRAYVFECKGKRFVGYVERFTPEARKAIAIDKKPTPQLYGAGRELKKPGDVKWVKSSDLGAVTNVVVVKCADGSPAEGPVEP